MSVEPQEPHTNLRPQLFKGKCGTQEFVKCCHYKGCKPVISLKQRVNSQQCHSSSNYIKRDPNRNLRSAGSKQYIQKIHRKDVHRQWEESGPKGNIEREESEMWSNVEHSKMSTECEEFNQVNNKEYDNTLEPGERLDYGEELAQQSALDWEVDLGQEEGFDSEEGEGSLELLSDSCSDQEEEIRGVAGRVRREKEGWEVDGNGKAVTLRSPVLCAKQSTLIPVCKRVAHKDGRNSNKTSLKLYDKLYPGGMFTDQFPDQFYTSHMYSNGLNTDKLCSQKDDADNMFSDVSDAGEALADTEGLSECELFEQTETSMSEREDGGDRRDTVMLSVGDGSESSSGLLSSFEEEDAEDEEQHKSENCSFQDLHSGMSKDSPHLDASEREAGILSQLPPYQPSSFPSCLSESEKNGSEVKITEMSQRYWAVQDDPEAKQNEFSDPNNFDTSIELNIPCISLPIPLQHEDRKSEMKQEKHFDEQEEDGPKVQECKSVMVSEIPVSHIEEHVYEDTEPKFQIKALLQTRKYLMTRSISVEAPTNRLDSVLGRERLMLHPQSYCLNQNFLSEHLPALTGSLGCLSPGRPCPSNDLGTTSIGIPPPFELSSITKRPIRKSAPALPSDLSASCRKLDLGFKRYFLPLRFLRKSERRSVADNRSVSSRSSSESSPQGSCKRLNLIRPSMGSPELQRAHDCSLPSSPSSFLQKNKQRQDLSAPFNNNIMSATPTSWDMLGVGSDEFIHSPFMKSLSFSKPRSFSSPNVDSSVYENVLNTSPHYENVQLRLLHPTNQKRNQASSNDTDGYVDMSSLPGFQNKNQSSEQETESAYTICSPTIRSDGTVSVSVGVTCTKTDENKSYERQTVSYSRSFYSVKELLDSETQHVKTVKLLCETVSADERLSKLWDDLPAIYTLHQTFQTQLETRIKEWDQKDGVADIILAKKAEFPVFSSFISHLDTKMKSLEQIETTLDLTSLKQQLLQVIVRVLQYRMLLTDYLNNLSPNSREYEDMKAALTVVADVADQASNNLSNGANLLRLVHIEHSVLGLKNLLQPGRAFVKEGTLMKVSRKCKQPRHLILMSDILLYTYPQQDGKFRLINTLSLSGMEVTKLVIENAQNALKVEVKDISITLSASTPIERDDWFVALNRTIADLGSLLGVSPGAEFAEKPGVCLGENAPPLVSISQVSVCMNCPTHFSLTHRRHHCHACGKVVCRDCCRNKVRLKYMKNRRAKVCDKCFSELCKHEEGDVAVVTESPSRPRSSIFQNIHPTSLWRSRKGQMTFNQVTESDGEMSGTLQRSRNSKRSWKSLWFLLKDKVLYTYPQPEEKVACESLPLLGFSVRSESEGESSVFQLYHKATLYYTFKAQDSLTAQRWVSAMEEATVL